MDKLTVFIGPSSYPLLVQRRVMRDFRERGIDISTSYARESRFVGPAYLNLIAQYKTKADIDLINDCLNHHEIYLGVDEIITALSQKID